MINTTFELPHYAPINPQRLIGMDLAFPLLDDYFVPVNMNGPFPTKELPQIESLLPDEEAVMLNLQEPFGFASYGPLQVVLRTQKTDGLKIALRKPGWWDVTMFTEQPPNKQDLDIAGKGLNVFITFAVQKRREIEGQQ